MRTIFINTLLICLTAFFMPGMNAKGQRISFGTWAGSDIVIRPVSVNTLDFGNLIKGAGNPNAVTLSGATAFEIIAPEGYDLTVTIDAPLILVGPNSKTIPFGLKFAYSNQGSLTVDTANSLAVEVSTGFSAVTFPVRRNAIVLPAPPPTPLDGSSGTRSTATAYLFLYGSAGPALADNDAGRYTGEVHVNVEYTSN